MTGCWRHWYADRTALVTGGSSGIGAAVVELLLEARASVHVADVIPSPRHEAVYHRCDLGKQAALDQLARELPRMDCLFNCVGSLDPRLSPIESVSVNFLGVRHLTDAVTDRMSAGGSVASVSSLGARHWMQEPSQWSGLVASPSFVAGQQWCQEHLETLGNGYLTAKRGIAAWTAASALALGRRGIRHNCTVPGPTRTPMLALLNPEALAEPYPAPIARIASAGEQADPLLFLNADAARYITGATLALDGGLSAAETMGQLHWNF